MRAGLLVGVSNCYKEAYCLRPIVWLSALTNCCLFAQFDFWSYNNHFGENFVKIGDNCHNMRFCMNYNDQHIQRQLTIFLSQATVTSWGVTNLMYLLIVVQIEQMV